jgi:hypothetical protein
MGMHYASFVVRCWYLSDEQRRFEVDHLQSGARTCVVTLSAAVDWMSAQCDRLTTPTSEVSPTDTSAHIDDRQMD